MCGIFGYKCTKDVFDPRLNTTIALGGVMMQYRGEQSWGWTDGENVAKAVGKLTNGFSPNLMGTKVGIVHTRQATTGEKTADNSHPFYIKGILGMHNGMIYNHKAVAEKFGYQYKVDSELIFHLIADGESMEELEGYGTIVYFQEGKLHLGRFSSRGDLHLAVTDIGWLFASTREAVVSAALMSGVEIVSWPEVPLGQLFQLDGNNMNLMPLELKLKPYTPVVTSYGTGGIYTGGGSSYHEGRTFGGGYSESGRFHGACGRDDDWDDDYPQHGKINAQTTTFTSSEPSSDADEVIDVSELSEADQLMLAAEDIMTGRAAVPDDMPQMAGYEPDDFHLTRADAFPYNKLVKCYDCLSLLIDDEPVYVNEWTRETFCDTCYEHNYSETAQDADAADEVFYSKFQQENKQAPDAAVTTPLLPSSTSSHLVM